MPISPTQDHAIRCAGRLGITLPCDLQRLKSAFRARARETHPDVEGGNEHDFRETRAAYDFFMDNPSLLEIDLQERRTKSPVSVEFIIPKNPRSNYGPCPECEGTGKPRDRSWWTDYCPKC